MSGRQTIKQRIAFEGGEEMKAQLKALGETGEKAFQKIASATKQAEFAKLGASLQRVGEDLATVGRRVALAFGAISTAGAAAGVAMFGVAKAGANAADAAGKAAQAAGVQVEAYGGREDTMTSPELLQRFREAVAALENGECRAYAGKKIQPHLTVLPGGKEE